MPVCAVGPELAELGARAQPLVEDGDFRAGGEQAVVGGGEAAEGISRLCALVVAPGIERRQLLAALRERIDPVFLPRPLILVNALPRNATGKLTRDNLQAFYADHKSDAGR